MRNYWRTEVKDLLTIISFNIQEMLRPKLLSIFSITQTQSDWLFFQKLCFLWNLMNGDSSPIGWKSLDVCGSANFEMKMNMETFG